MIKDNDLDFVYNGEQGVALSWVINEDSLYDLPLTVPHARIFLDTNSVIDVSEEYPDHNGITVKLLKDEEELEIFQTTEYFGSILLSNPTVVNLSLHKYGNNVTSPNAKFINYKFENLDDELNLKYGWGGSFDPEDDEIFAICTPDMCNCGRPV